MNTNKILAYAIMAVLIVSIIPAAFADDVNVTGTDVNVNVRPTAVATGLRTQLGDNLRAAREQVLGLRNANLHARVDLATSALEVNDARTKLLKDKDALSNVCTTTAGNVTDDCTQMREQVKLEAEATLLTSADHIINLLNTIKDRAQANDALSQSEKDQISSDVDAAVAKIQAARDKLAALDETSSKADLSEAAKEIRDAWTSVRPVVKGTASQLSVGELQAVTDSVKKLSDTLQTTIDRMKSNGADTSAADALKATFDKSIADAQTHLDNAAAAAAGVTADNMDANLKTVRDEMQAARSSLQSAHDTLKQIAQTLRDSIKQNAQAARNETQAARDQARAARVAARQTRQQNASGNSTEGN